MVKTSPAETFVMSQSQLLRQLLVVAFDNPTMFRSFYQLFLVWHGPRKLKASTWSVRFPAPAIRSTTILRHGVRFANSPDEQVLLAVPQNGSAIFASCPDATKLLYAIATIFLGNCAYVITQ